MRVTNKVENLVENLDLRFWNSPLAVDVYSPIIWNVSWIVELCVYCLILPQIQEELAEKYGLGEPVAANMIYTKYRCEKSSIFVQMIMAQNWFHLFGYLRMAASERVKKNSEWLLFICSPAGTDYLFCKFTRWPTRSSSPLPSSPSSSSSSS